MQYSLKYSPFNFLRYVLSIAGTLLLFLTTSFAEEAPQVPQDATLQIFTQQIEPADVEPITFSSAVNVLNVKSFKKKSVAIDVLVEIKD